jgi:molybdopterin molybdotransferase
MIAFEDALKIVHDAVYYEMSTERISINDSLGRILAKDIVSDINMPPFPKSAMDGYAIRYEDLKNEWDVLEVIAAGQKPEKNIGTNQCSKIMTGAMMPEGADCVIKVEESEVLTNGKVRFIVEDTKTNFVPMGEDVRVNDLVLKKGTLLNAQHLAVAAAVGYDNPRVFKKVRVGVISTGDELVEPHITPGPSQIRNSNAYQLMAQLQKMNVTPLYFGIARDTEEATTKVIKKAIDDCDVILLTGGVSMGDFDFVPKIFDEIGVEIKFKEMAVQPGKPTVFGVLKNKFIFGLPGNPVSSFNIFEILTKPLIYKMMGYDFKSLEIRLPMGVAYNRKRSTRKSFLPVKIEDGKIWPIDYHGSAHIFALTEANAWISVPVGVATLNEGEIVDVRQI